MPKTLISYPRPFYVFSLILYLNKCIIAQYMISGSYVHYSKAGGFRDHFGAEKKKEKKIGSNVMTFQCCDVPAS